MKFSFLQNQKATLMTVDLNTDLFCDGPSLIDTLFSSELIEPILYFSPRFSKFFSKTIQLTNPKTTFSLLNRIFRQDIRLKRNFDLVVKKVGFK